MEILRDPTEVCREREVKHIPVLRAMEAYELAITASSHKSVLLTIG